jgi:hypothetical protein
MLRKLGVFCLALLTAFVIMILVTLPLMFGVWLLLKYAAGQ